MAPAKPPPSSISAKNLATSMSSPVSLLWAHQLRREHSALSVRLEDLANAVSNVSTAKLDKIAAQTMRADKKSSEVKSEQMKFKQELDRMGERDKGLHEEVATIRDRIEVSERSTLALPKNVQTQQEMFKKDIFDKIIMVERDLHLDQEERDQQVYHLQAEIRDLQKRLPDIVNEGIIGVKDSMEEIRAERNRKAASKSHPTDRMTDGEAPHASGLVQPNSEPPEMLTVQQDLNTEVNPCLAGDIDLDEDMPTHESEAKEVVQMPERDTMAMLPELPIANFLQSKDLSSLKQGKFQSWDRYLAACANLIDTLPKRKEGVVVEAFVDGIYDEKLRRKCETMLDEVGWAFKSVKDFVEKHVSGEMETQARQRTGVLTHKHSRGQVCPVCPKKANLARNGGTAIDTFTDNPPRNTLFQAVQGRQTAVPKRRSQRIHLQSQESQVAPSILVDPTSPERSAPEPVEKPPCKFVLKEMPKETRTMTGKAKEKRPATGSNDPGSAWGGRDANVQNYQAGKQQQQQQELQAATTDRRTWNDTNTTGQESPRTEKPSLQQERRPPPTSNFKPIWPPNPAVPQQWLDLGNNNSVNTNTGPGQGLEMQSSKKRKLVEQLEVPVVTAERALMTPLDKRTERDGADEEPERKKRRKKQKRAVVPIPKIPILPLSDDD